MKPSEKSKKWVWGKKGSVTVFLTGILASFLFITGVLAEAAAGEGARSCGDAALEQAGRAVLSEYDRELQERYGLFAFRLSGEEAEERILHYVSRSLEKAQGDLFRLSPKEIQADLTTYSLLNLSNTEEQIMEHMKYRAAAELAGLAGILEKSSMVFGLTDAMETAEESVREAEQAKEAMERADRRLGNASEEEDKDALEAQAASEKAAYERALEQGESQIEEVRRKASELAETAEELEGALNRLGTETEGEGTAAGAGREGAAAEGNEEPAEGEEEQTEGETAFGSRILKNRSVIDSLPGSLMGLKPGGSLLSGLTDDSDSALWTNLCISLYIMDKYGHHLNGKEAENSFFLNEGEYILWGAYSDRENYDKTRTALITLRTGLNLAHIYSDPQKVEALTAAAAALTPGPLAPLTQFLLSAAWAAGEAAQDMERLEAGEAVPLWKGPGDWQLSLENLMSGNLKAAEISGQGKGLTYEEYLLLFLFLSDKEQKLLRLLDLAELNLKISWDGAFAIKDCSCGLAFEAQLQRKGGFLNVAGARRGHFRQVHEY